MAPASRLSRCQRLHVPATQRDTGWAVQRRGTGWTVVAWERARTKSCQNKRNVNRPEAGAARRDQGLSRAFQRHGHGHGQPARVNQADDPPMMNPRISAVQGALIKILVTPTSWSPPSTCRLLSAVLPSTYHERHLQRFTRAPPASSCARPLVWPLALAGPTTKLRFHPPVAFLSLSPSNLECASLCPLSVLLVLCAPDHQSQPFRHHHRQLISA